MIAMDYDDDDVSEVKTLVVPVAAAPLSTHMPDDVTQNYRWLSRFNTTTFNMFICHDLFEYIRNERYCDDLYHTTYRYLYGNAFEIFTNNCKFYVTERFLTLNNVHKSLFPNEAVVKQGHLTKVAYLLDLKTVNGVSLKTHIINAMNRSNCLGLSIVDKNNAIKCMSNDYMDSVMEEKYCWNSEDRKVKVCKAPVKECPIEALFRKFFSENSPPSFKTMPLNHNEYYKEFVRCMESDKKIISDYYDSVTNLKWLFKDIAAVLCTVKGLKNLNTVDGDTDEVIKFLRESKKRDVGHMFLHLKIKETKRERFRLNCFKMDKEHVWINSMVFSKINKDECIDVKNIIKQHCFGTHHIINIGYVFNTKLTKYHTNVTKHVVRYILSRRKFNLLKYDVANQKHLNYDYVSYE